MTRPKAIAAKRGKTVERDSGLKQWLQERQIAGLKVTLVQQRQRSACQSQGLRARVSACVVCNHSVTVIDTPENRGMINKVSYLLQVEEA